MSLINNLNGYDAYITFIIKTLLILILLAVYKYDFLLSLIVACILVIYIIHDNESFCALYNKIK